MPSSSVSQNSFPTLATALQQVELRTDHSYLARIADPSSQVYPPAKTSACNQLRMLRITQFIFSSESIHERLVSVYRTLHQMVQSCFLLIEGTACSTSLYMGLRADAPAAALTALRRALEGNFPGMLCEELNGPTIASVMDRLDTPSGGAIPCSVAAMAMIPSERSQQTTEETDVQGLEKFIDTMQGSEYMAIILSVPYTRSALTQRITALENICTLLSGYEEISTQQSRSEAASTSAAQTDSAAHSILQNLTLGYSDTSTQSSFRQSGSGHGMGLSPLGLGMNWNWQNGAGTGTASSTGTSVTAGTTKGSTYTRGTTTTTGQSITEGQSVTVRQKNKQISNLLQRLDRQIQRLQDGLSYGLWDCCAYFCAPDTATATMAAHTFQAVAAGSNTGLEHSICALWQPTLPGAAVSNIPAIQNLLSCLKNAEQPRFHLQGSSVPCVTDSAVLGSELPRMMGLPHRSVAGLTVLRMADFGRTVHYTAHRLHTGGPLVEVGNVVHTGKVMPQTVSLDLHSFTAHTLLTGASGSGKTTITCQLLEHLVDNHVNFTVIEPAKGEYAALWAALDGIRIYTTAPREYQMLRINPFAFDPAIHILDHIDRLIDIFSVCWPLYAAQPALLRECVRRAYVRRGWDLTNSVCLPRPSDPFPTFRDLVEILPDVIESSRLVGDARGSYEGTLTARFTMLVNGIYGQIFCTGQNLSDTELFDGRTILDLSRVGSSETLSLIMGILLIRLYEYRTAHHLPNSGLQHVTVLEEAHNILRRAAAPAAAEDSAGSVGGKAVECLVKCIAELRFTGEGFLIVDQSPSELDDAAIKNTSTKIALRLSHAKDQDAMSRAMNLTAEQAAELARLPNGTAIALQESWAEPVMLKAAPSQRRWKACDPSHSISYDNVRVVRGFLLGMVLEQLAHQRYDADALCSAVTGRIRGLSRWKQREYSCLLRYFETRFQRIAGDFRSARCHMPFFGELIEALLECDGLFELAVLPHPTRSMQAPYSRDPSFRALCQEWSVQARQALSLYADSLNDNQISQALRCMLLYHGEKDTTAILVCSVVFGKSSSEKS